MTDPVSLTQDLIRCASVTPADEGAMEICARALERGGFDVTRVDRGGIANLYARWGTGRTLGFNGHTDVVPPGARGDWSVDPFGGEIRDGILYGRGATDMKSGVAAFIAAAVDVIASAPPKGAIVVTITGDEEGDATDGTTAILDWMAANGAHMDACLVGEPTCPERMGDMIKIGRRGSMTAYLTATGQQGHSAYPGRARNPLPPLVAALDELARAPLDEGTAHFDPSTLALTTIDTGNPANNVIPPQAKATLNIRFNDAHDSAALSAWIREVCSRHGAVADVEIDVRIKVSGESFITEPGPFSDIVARAVEAETGVVPVLSTSGGTSDARFIRAHCPVVEFGLVGRSMHQVDEHVSTAEIHQLKAIYSRIITDFLREE